MKNNSGFTLMELMTVIAIVLILSAIAIPNMISWKQNRVYTTSLQRTLAAMRSAKAHAVKENVPTIIRFNVAGQSFRVFIDEDFDNAWTPGTDRQVDFYQMPSGVRISDAAFGDFSWVSFDGQGMPNGLGGRVEITSDRGLSNAVTVNITGRIQLPPA